MKSWSHFFSKGIPTTSWTARHRWDLNAKRILFLSLSLLSAGIGEAIYIRANLGNAPWLVLGDALTLILPVSIAVSSFLISIMVVILWIPLKEKLGFGVIANTLIVAIGIHIGIKLVPEQHSLFGGAVFILISCLLLGLGNAVFITCGLGPGPRQGLMTALHRITKIRVSRLTLAHETTALTLGAILGGNYGIGTFIYLALIGPSLAFSFALIKNL